MSASRKFVYIFSAGHSGSTLLDLLLGSHSRMHSAGELTQLPKNIALNTVCSCGKRVRCCSFWSAVIERLSSVNSTDYFGDPYSLDLGYIGSVTVVDREHETVSYRSRWKVKRMLAYCGLRMGDVGASVSSFLMGTAVRNTLLLYDVMRDVSGASVIVDSSKDYLKGTELFRRAGKEMLPVLLVRDGRGVLWSGLRRGMSRPKALRRWTTYYWRALGLLERYVPPSSLITVQYESLVRHPEAELTRILRELSLPAEDGMLRFSQHEHHVANGNDLRLRRGVKLEEDRSWERFLTKSDHEYFWRRAGDLAARLGYGKEEQS